MGKRNNKKTFSFFFSWKSCNSLDLFQTINGFDSRKKKLFLVELKMANNKKLENPFKRGHVFNKRFLSRFFFFFVEKLSLNLGQIGVNKNDLRHVGVDPQMSVALETTD